MRYKLKDNHEVAHYFANQVQARGEGSNFYFEDGKLYSYGRHFCIARHLPNGMVAFTTRHYGPATSKHLSYARGAMSHLKLVYCYDPSKNALLNRDRAWSEIKSELDEAETTRRVQQKTRDGHRGRALMLAERFNEYLAALPENERGIAQPFQTDGDYWTTMREAHAAELERERQQAEDNKRRLAAEQQDRLNEWRAGASITGSMYALPVALRIDKSRDVIQTSHGAEIPLKHGIALWPIVQSVVHGERTPEEARKLVHRLGVYTLTRIHKDGSIVVGCHNIAYTELHRIAKQLGLTQDVLSGEPA